MDYPDPLVLASLVEDEGLAGLRHERLPPIRLQFFIPRLSDKPQDPIVNTLKHIDTVAFPSLDAADAFTTELPLPVLDVPTAPERDTPSDFWQRALKSHPEQLTQVKSWDTLRPSFDKRASSSPFLSEQTASVLSSARKVMAPQVVDPDIPVVATDGAELLLALRGLVIGNSSRLFQWHAGQETFDLGGIVDEHQIKFVVDGWDTLLLASYLQRFVNIGCALRRLDVFIESLRESKDGPTIYSFSHALLLVVDLYRKKLAASESEALWDHMSSRLWAELEEAEEVLLVLTAMCGRDISHAADEYPEFPRSATALLSTIYGYLEDKRLHHASRVVVAVLSYILTSTSVEYFALLGKSVSYNQDDSDTNPSDPLDAAAEPDYDEDSDENDKESDRNDSDNPFPTFFSSSTIAIITRARVSLQLLRTAEPHHPLLHAAYHQRALQWIWTVGEVEALADDRVMTPRTVHQSFASTQDSLDDRSKGSETTLREFDPVANVLDQFRVFDLDPSNTAHDADEPHAAVQMFIDTFPSDLPALTPTLTHLFDLVISPLMEHCSSISSALLKVILSPSRPLHLPTHLRLVRDHVLLTSPIFKRRLGHALLSDSDSWESESSSSLALAKRSSGRSTPVAVSGDTWAVGLGLGLIERTSWPPGGSDLSYYLRTVIVDSLEIPDTLDRSTISAEVQARARILSEAEFRLGFSIRDLPTGAGRDRWLDPCCEALDFLLMTYKPPAPLDVVITDNALSKCQRIFTFAMRLLRVQHACAALYRMTRDTRAPLFETHAVVNRHLLHFRFMAQNFVDTLVSYVFDVAIRGNYDAFLDRLEAPSVPFSDISAVAEEYSGMLDNILSACLLRSSQRSISDLLRGLLELVLDFCTLCGEMRRSNLEEYKAVPIFEEVFARYRRRMLSLVNALKNIVEKQSASSYLPADYAHLALGADERFASGATGNLYQLLMRLDVNDWISSRAVPP
ncbi:hypothetical protein PENSPDRAFT_578992 [Peniophora sp. CONT]|nr:hypothetical protein PENSPDRAFT_578992 [Peniophora sp. CONT]